MSNEMKDWLSENKKEEKSLKAIFLDVDGVLNDAHTPDRAPGGFIGIDDGMVTQLKRIIDHTQAVVILTSTWKSEWEKNREESTVDGKYLEDCLLKHEISILDKTTDHISNRGEGISNYLKDHPEIDNWVVLDDDIFYDYEKYGIMPHLVKTSFGYGGLSQAFANEAIYRLNQ